MPTVVTAIAAIGTRFDIANADTVYPSSVNKYQNVINQKTSQDKALYNSPLKTPVVTDLTFKGASYIDHNHKTVTFKSITLATVLISVSQEKRIVETFIEGRNGSIKEYIGMGDYQVTINGIIAGPNGSYPMDIVNTLNQICKSLVAVDVVSRYLQNLDIHSLVIKSFHYDQEPGGYSKQNFSIEAVSDTPIILTMF